MTLKSCPFASQVIQDARTSPVLAPNLPPCVPVTISSAGSTAEGLVGHALPCAIATTLTAIVTRQHPAFVKPVGVSGIDAGTTAEHVSKQPPAPRQES